VQAQVVNLLMDLQAELGIAYLFVAHDLAVVRHISHRVAVMYLGQMMEVADRDTLFAAPRHPYTEILLSAVPVPNPGSGRSACCCRAIRRARESAAGMPVPHPLSAGAAGLSRGAAAADPARFGGRNAVGGLPLSMKAQRHEHIRDLRPVIRGGTVIDGTKAPRFDADVGIKERPHRRRRRPRRRERGAHDRRRRPDRRAGFIDSHTHDDQALIARPDMDFKVSQGVTTVIAGNCGISAAPLVRA
jgi:hypothetical protein